MAESLRTVSSLDALHWQPQALNPATREWLLHGLVQLCGDAPGTCIKRRVLCRLSFVNTAGSRNGALSRLQALRCKRDAAVFYSRSTFVFGWNLGRIHQDSLTNSLASSALRHRSSRATRWMCCRVAVVRGWNSDSSAAFVREWRL